MKSEKKERRGFPRVDVSLPATIGHACPFCARPVPVGTFAHDRCWLEKVRDVFASRDRQWPTEAELQLREAVRRMGAK